MKIRQGFVSNSSSSSFMICLNNDDISYESIKEQLFPKQDDNSSICHIDTYIEKLNCNSSVKEVVEHICNEISPLTAKQVNKFIFEYRTKQYYIRKLEDMQQRFEEGFIKHDEYNKFKDEYFDVFEKFESDEINSDNIPNEIYNDIIHWTMNNKKNCYIIKFDDRKNAFESMMAYDNVWNQNIEYFKIRN